MKKICIIGDSHVGVVMPRRVHEFILDTAELTFFTAHLNLFAALELRGAKLVPQDDDLTTKFKIFSRGKGEIDLDAYDEFIVIGLSFGMRVVTRKYLNFSCDSMAFHPNGRYRLTDDCYIADSECAAAATQAFRISGMIRRVSDRKITVVPVPNPGWGIPEAELAPNYDPVHAIVSDGNDLILAKLFCDVCAKLALKHQINVVPPIAEVALNGVFNKYEFSALSERKKDEPESTLMNAMVHGSEAYGRRLADVLFTGNGVGSG